MYLTYDFFFAIIILAITTFFVRQEKVTTDKKWECYTKLYKNQEIESYGAIKSVLFS